MQRGRPTLNEQEKIKETLFPYYENNIEASTASKETVIDYKTVLKYYKIWNKEIFGQEENDFLIRVKTAKEKCIRVFDADIISLTDLMKQIEPLLKQSLRTGNLTDFETLTKLKLKTMDQRTKIQSAKINLIGAPTADYVIHQEVIQNGI